MDATKFHAKNLLGLLIFLTFFIAPIEGLVRACQGDWVPLLFAALGGWSIFGVIYMPYISTSNHDQD